MPGLAYLAYLYSLYDALVSIHVPNDKARAVVDAMERDMGTTIATKADLQMLRQELTSQISSLATRAEVLAVKAELRHFGHDELDDAIAWAAGSNGTPPGGDGGDQAVTPLRSPDPTRC